MAYALEDDKLKREGDQNNVQAFSGGAPGVSGGGSAESGVVSGGSGGSATQAPQAGTGGKSGFTNIQNYIYANPNNETGGTNALQNSAGKAYTDQQESLNKAANESRTQADTEVGYTFGKDKASQLVDQASKQVAYKDGKFAGGVDQSKVRTADDTTDPYSKIKDQLVNAYGRQYQGTPSFSFAETPEAAAARSALGEGTDDDKFYNYLNQQYNKNGQSGAGVSALQNQFDRGNQVLQSARQDLAAKYAKEPSELQKSITDADSYAKKARDTYQSNQKEVQEYLPSASSEYSKSIDDTIKSYQDAQTAAKRQLEIRPWASIKQGVDADRTNVAESKDARNKYNVIQDALFGKDYLGQSDQNAVKDEFRDAPVPLDNLKTLPDDLKGSIYNAGWWADKLSPKTQGQAVMDNIAKPVDKYVNNNIINGLAGGQLSDIEARRQGLINNVLNGLVPFNFNPFNPFDW
jgi:hypothetical protein